MAGKTGTEAIEKSITGMMPAEMLKTWVSALFRPAEIFKAEKKNADFGNVVKTLGFVGLVAAAIVGIALIIAAAFQLGVVGAAAGPGGAAVGASIGIMGALVAAIIGLILYPIIMNVYGFILSAIYFIIAKVLGGKGAYMEQTLGLALIMGGVVVLNAPFQILGIIPVVGTLFSLVTVVIVLYALYSQYRLMKEVHKLSSMRAAAVVILPMVLIFLLIVVIGAAAILSYLSFTSA